MKIARKAFGIAPICSVILAGCARGSWTGEITFGLTESSEVFGNATGGVRRGVIYEGLTQFGIEIDTEKAFGWTGGTFNATGYQIHGRGLSINNLGNNLHTVSSLEAPLWHAAVRTLVRAGDVRKEACDPGGAGPAADQEFMISQYAGLFLNHTFGWSTFPSSDLPSGGPAYRWPRQAPESNIFPGTT